MLLQGKVAIISGGGSGIGAAVARRFAAEGASVVLTGRRAGPIEALGTELDGLAITGDATDPAHAPAVVNAATARFGGVDIVVANAGVGLGGSVGDVSDEDWSRTLDVNLTGAMRLARAAIPGMVERGGGSIVLVASVAGFVASPSSAAYGASKAGLIALAGSITVDHARHGIRANALCPGWVRTPMGDEAMDDLASDRGITRDAAYGAATALAPSRRAGEPEEIAACALFLASDESSFVSGTTLIADGGMLAVDPGGVAFDPTDEEAP
jgi:meso-butanediol dehydrogenase/(S,S)-butanediol dehydrogenase/diacetyl reductase